MNILVTGCAGFIGSKVSELLLKEGHTVIGVDNLNQAYDPRLKEWRLKQLQSYPLFQFHSLDISHWTEMDAHKMFLAWKNGCVRRTNLQWILFWKPLRRSSRFIA